MPKRLNDDYFEFDVQGTVSGIYKGEYVSLPFRDKINLLHGEVKTEYGLSYFELNNLYWTRFKNGETRYFRHIEVDRKTGEILNENL